MTQFTNVSGYPLDIPLIGQHVDPDQNFDVPEELIGAFALQTSLYTSDDPAVQQVIDAHQAMPPFSAAATGTSAPQESVPGDLGKTVDDASAAAEPVAGDVAAGVTTDPEPADTTTASTTEGVQA